MTHTLRGLGELIAYLPYELGFVPTDSLVVVGLTEGLVDVVARIDLVPRAGYFTAIDRTAAAFDRAGVHDVICCLVLNGVVPVDCAQALLSRARARLRSGGIDVRHLLVANDGMWWAHLCQCRFCPTERTRIPCPERVDAVFASVLEGVAPLSSRDALAVGLRGCEVDVAAQVEVEFRRSRALSTEELCSSLRQILCGDAAVDRIPAQRLAAISMSLTDPILRDDVFGWVTPGLPLHSGDDGATATPLQQAWALLDEQARSTGVPALTAAAVRERMTQWLHCLPDALRPPVLTFIAGSAWSCGSGALAAVALEQAQQIDPNYRLAKLLSCVVGAGLRPGQRPESAETSVKRC